MKCSLSIVLSTVAALNFYSSFVTACPQQWTFDSTPVSGPCEAKFISDSSGIDFPMVSCINNTNFDWWYFDAVSPDLQTSVVIVFYLATLGFSFIDDTAEIVPTVGLFFSFPNGTIAEYTLSGSEAIISSSKSGESISSFVVTSSDLPAPADEVAHWTSTDDLKNYVVTINSPSTSIFGTFELNSIAPPHYPCGPNESGQNMMVGPNIGWSNAVPDAIGTVNFTVDGTDLDFSGVAYHDKNWSNKPFMSDVGSWYWGHGRVGNYSIVWFDLLTTNGTEHVSSYISYSGDLLTASCTPGSIAVRPTGSNSLFPPTQTSGNPEGFNITFNLGDEHCGFLNVTANAIVAGGKGLYTRWLGTLAGEIDGEVLTDGVALYEAFALEK